MQKMRYGVVSFALAALLLGAAAPAQQKNDGDSSASTRPADRADQQQIGRLPSVLLDRKNRQVRVACQALNADQPLEFFCVIKGGQEYESVLRTTARPSQIHFALLALGLTPGRPAHYVQSTNTWYAPTGPPLNIFCEFVRNGQPMRVPAYEMMRSVKTRRPMPPLNWVFDGSEVMPNGQYAADITGYVVSIVNFDLTMIDVPELASNANETLEWEYNPQVVPKAGTPVTMIIEPATEPTTRAPQTRSGANYNPGPGAEGGMAPGK